MRGFLLAFTLAALALLPPPGAVSAQDRFPIVEKFPPVVTPTPRPGITAKRVLRPERVRGGPAVVEAYTVARLIPSILDGLPSYCHVGRSLLSCFESRQGEQCAYCRLVVHRAYALHRQGRDLAYIQRWHVESIPGVDYPAPRSRAR